MSNNLAIYRSKLENTVDKLRIRLLLWIHWLMSKLYVINTIITYKDLWDLDYLHFPLTPPSP